MLPYTEVIAGASTNVTTPTTEQIEQGNNPLTPYNSAVNNGYYRQISEGVFDLSAEIQNVISAGGVTPSTDNDNLITALNNLYPLIDDLGSAAYVDTGTGAGDVPLNSTLTAQRFESSPQTITIGGQLTLAHGLGVQPKSYEAFLKCISVEANYDVGDETTPRENDTNDNGPGYGVALIIPNADISNIYVRFGNLKIMVLDKTTGDIRSITPAKWQLIVRANAKF